MELSDATRDVPSGEVHPAKPGVTRETFGSFTSCRQSRRREPRVPEHPTPVMFILLPFSYSHVLSEEKQ